MQFFKKYKIWNNNIFEMRTEFSLREWKRNQTIVVEEYCWAITQAVMLRPISFCYVSVRNSLQLPCIYTYSLPYAYSITTCENFQKRQTFRNMTTAKVREWQYCRFLNTRWFKYDRDKLWLVYTQIVPVIFEPPCTTCMAQTVYITNMLFPIGYNFWLCWCKDFIVVTIDINATDLNRGNSASSVHNDITN
jgi:hypothetical protein